MTKTRLSVCFTDISSHFQGDPGENGAPGKPGTAAVRWCVRNLSEHLLLLFLKLDLLCFLYQDVEKGLASLGIEVFAFLLVEIIFFGMFVLQTDISHIIS